MQESTSASSRCQDDGFGGGHVNSRDGDYRRKTCRVLAYVQPVRTFLPVSGVGRHINGMLSSLSKSSDVQLELLFAKQWLTSDGRLPVTAPLRELRFRAFQMPERLIERSWKLFGRPRMDRYLKDVDLLYSPADTVFPRSDVPSYITLHDVHPLDPLYPGYDRRPGWISQRRRWEHWTPKLFESATAVLTVSDFCRRRMEALVDTRNTPIHVVGNGVDPFFFSLAERDPTHCRIPGPWPYALVIGGLTDRKGAAETVRVAEQLRQQGSEVRIVVVGRSEPRWATVAKEHRNIVQAGVVSDEVMGEYLRAASCLLFLSLYEGFGIPIIEAMAAGVPAVVSNTSSLPEVAGDAGCVLPAGECGAIARTLDNLASGGGERERLVQRGAERAKGFTWHACVNRLRNVIGDGQSATIT